MIQVSNMRLLAASLALVAGGISLTAGAQNIPDGARIGASPNQPLPPITVPSSGTAAPAALPSSTIPASLSTANRRTAVVTSGPLGRAPAQPSVPAGKSGIVSAPDAATAAATATANGASGVGHLPAAVHTRGHVRQLSHQLDAPAGGRQIDAATAYAALNTKQAPTTPLDSPLPGLGMAPGSEKPVDPVVIHCRPGENAMIPVAENFPNRFDTPFVDPHVIDTKGDDSNMRVANSVFLTATRTTPFAIWIVDGKAGSQMCSLTLIPQNIPAQNLVLQMEGAMRGDPAKAFAPGAQSEETGREDQYTIGLRTLMRTVARGIAPRGFSEERLDVGMAVSNGIAATPEHLYAGSHYDIYIYRLTNKSRAPVTLSEEAFGTKGVRAVAFNPYIILPPGQSTEVYIIADRPDADASDSEAEVGLQ